MAKKINVFHFSSNDFTATHFLNSDFNYLWISLERLIQVLNEGSADLFGEQFLSKEKRSVFIFEFIPETVFSEEVIKKLPNFQIIYNTNQVFGTEFFKILSSKFAVGLEFQDINSVFSFVNGEYAVKQSGFKLNNDSIQISSTFLGKVKKEGHSFLKISGIFREEFEQVVVWRMTSVLPKAEQHVFFPEVKILAGEIDLLFKIHIFSESTHKLIHVVEATIQEVRNEVPIILQSQEESAYFNVSIYLKGKGSIQIGQIHVRRAISSRQSMIPGGANLLEHEQNGDGLFYYFNPGDFKPPLAVYFSGYRPLEGFEGLGMMSKMGCPFMLIADPRLEGGNFYLSSSKLEESLAQIIQGKLDFLGFTNQELVLSGLSMGTFGALYYASFLSPKCVIIGKPLTNLGLIAENGRINRTQEFATSFDMMRYNVKGISEEKIEESNQLFWLRFKEGNYADTTFAIAYMEQDDYDIKAFSMIYDFLKVNYPTSRLLYRGFIGRHNDNSSAINSWFIKQYRNLLWLNYQRTFGKIV